jgi:hypothetical protein
LIERVPCSACGGQGKVGGVFGFRAKACEFCDGSGVVNVDGTSPAKLVFNDEGGPPHEASGVGHYALLGAGCALLFPILVLAVRGCDAYTTSAASVLGLALLATLGAGLSASLHTSAIGMIFALGLSLVIGGIGAFFLLFAGASFH